MKHASLGQAGRPESFTGILRYVDRRPWLILRLRPVVKVDLGREMITRCGAWRSDGRAVGQAGAVVAERQEVRQAADMAEAAAD
ncbi:hypothetical protein [Streptomyces sp. NPDC055400]